MKVIMLTNLSPSRRSCKSSSNNVHGWAESFELGKERVEVKREVD